MAFSFLSSSYNGTLPTSTYTANTAVAKGDVVVLVTGANKSVDPAAALAGAATFTVGVAMHAANAAAEVLVQHPLPGTEWVADATENCQTASIGTLLTMNGAGTVTNGTAANQGGRVIAKKMWGLANANKWVVSFNQANCRY